MYEWLSKSRSTIKWLIETNVSIDAVQSFENTSNSQLATLFCCASIASSVGIHLYSKYKHNSKYQKCCLNSFDYNNYKRILRASAPGKIILSGEHGVFEGITCISTAINKRTYITIYEPMDIHRVINDLNVSSPTNSKLILKLNQDVILSWKISDLIAIHNLNINKWHHKLIENKYVLLKPMISFINDDIHRNHMHALYGEKEWDKRITCVLLLLLFQCFNKLFTDQLFISNGIAIDVSSQIPIDCGLGSSSALYSSLSAALYYYWVYVTAGQRKTKVISRGVETTSRIWKLSHELQKINGATCTPITSSSGIDNTTCIYGGYISYKNKNDFSIVDIKPKIPLLVINSMVNARNAKKLKHSVKRLYTKHNEIISTIFSSIDAISEKMIHILQNENISSYDLYKNVNQLFAINHGLLISIGVGLGHNVNNIQNICNQYNLGKGLKITGDGGGGASIIVNLLNKDNKIIDRLRRKLLSKGYKTYVIETGQPGLSCKFY